MQTPDEEIRKPGIVKRFAKLVLWLIAAIIFLRLAISPFWTFHKIPRTHFGGALPTMMPGDFLVVKKNYGEPQRGDLMIFQYKDDIPAGNVSIARIAAITGDTLEYRNKHIWINGVEQEQANDGDFNYIVDGNNGQQFVSTRRYVENLSGRTHSILIVPDKPNINSSRVSAFEGSDNCVFENETLVCKIPDGLFFMIGDNRDDSLDSRYRGFVSKEQFIGKPTYIWANLYISNRRGMSVN